MRNMRLWLVILSALLLCGCQGAPDPKESAMPDTVITVGEREYSVSDVNAGIKNTFNKNLYLYRSVIFLDSEDVIGKEIRYELYYFENAEKRTYEETTIFFVITLDVPKHIFDGGYGQYIIYGIDINERGMMSYFSYYDYGQTHEKGKQEFISGVNLLYIGDYTMHIDQIEKPVYEEMDAEWAEIAKNRIMKHMDENPGGYSDVLEPGKYHVYVKRFFEADENSDIFFEHENGNVYTGKFHFVHDGGFIDKIFLENRKRTDSEENRKMRDRIRSDPAVSLDYEVKE
ncbi:hypothetical protein LJC55_02145 [Eubacteriales bacterium OttesenSCG-928-N14]|nr:hypothetical protein [Eubacteriales bacterium OttesenSCG-928-N14]